MFPDRPLRPGLFFSFEGVDGSGKSTQARLLVDTLREAGHRAEAVREPGGTALGEQIRALLLNPDSEINPRAELLLFAAARAQLVADVIEPLLASGTHVVADRYTDSTVAYQGAGRQLAHLIRIDDLNDIATGGRMPDRTYLIMLSREESARRRARRSADRMERTDDAFSARVADAYAHLAKQSAGRVVTLDGLQPVPVLHAAIERDALAHIESAG